MYKIFSLLLFAVFLHAQMVDGVAILVKKEPITIYDIQKEIRLTSQPLNKVVDNLIRKKLEAQEIKERNIKVNSQEVYEDLKNMAKQNGMSLTQLYEAMQRSRGISESVLKQKIKEKILNQKLYSAIAFSKMSEPSEDDEQEYYNLHKEDFSYSDKFDVTIYSCASKEKLQQKIDNPMFYVPQVRSEDAQVEYTKINPQLAKMLAKTPLNRFTPIVPAPDRTFMSFFIKNRSEKTTMPFEQIRPQIKSAIMQERRQKVLNDYFMRLRMNADIEIIRLTDT